MTHARKENACHTKVMKKRWIVAALCLGALAPACKDKEAAPPPAQEQQTPPAQADAPAPQAQNETAQPTEADIRAQLLPALAEFPAVKLGEVQMDITSAGQGEFLIAARVQTLIGENLYTQENAPEMLNEERKAANEAINQAMLPELHYLLQVGADTSLITEEDRRIKPLPNELQKAADELKRMAEAPIYHLHTTASTAVEIPATMRAHRVNGYWDFSEISFDTAALRSLVGTLPEGALPKDAAVVREGFEQQQRLAVREKVAAFNEAAKPYIDSREDAARKRVLEAQARREEEEKAAAEQAAAQAACHEIWEQACSTAFKENAVFTGEWKRGDTFGRIALRLTKVHRFQDSLQFIGLLYNPEMPQAEMHVIGRCEAPSSPPQPISMVVRIYNGRYDPDAPTAEVFDAKDALLRLKLGEERTLSGEMTCEAWADTPDKAFTITLAPPPAKAPRRR